LQLINGIAPLSFPSIVFFISYYCKVNNDQRPPVLALASCYAKKLINAAGLSSCKPVQSKILVNVKPSITL